jgi:hypothetical protein
MNTLKRKFCKNNALSNPIQIRVQLHEIHTL